MIESCANCGKPLVGVETAAGPLCSACGQQADGDASVLRPGLLPGEGWSGRAQLGPIGAIGGELPRPDVGQSRVGDPIEFDDASSTPPHTRDATAAEHYRMPAHPAPFSPPSSAVEPAPNQFDPDRPPWGVGMAILVWLASVLAIILVPLAGVVVWLVVRAIAGYQLGNRANAERLLESPQAALVLVVSTLFAHVFTLGIIWLVVTRAGRRPAREVLGWRWTGLSPGAKVGFVLGTVILMYVIAVALTAVFPESKETDFMRLLKTSASVRAVVAFLAVFTAPVVEECVYRGVLYSALRRALGEWPAVFIVATLFTGVHLQQYWGAWAGIASIAVLSLTLTLIRDKTKSILPCIAVHMVFNAVDSIFILLHRY